MTQQIKGRCPECGRRTMLWLIREDVTLCDDCAADEGWDQCEFCGDFYPDDLIEVLDDDRQICKYCLEDYPNNDPLRENSRE